MTEIFRAENLNVGYDGKTVIAGVELCAEQGQVICLIGPNGGGKTTILRTFAGLLAPISGSIYLDGEKINARKAAVHAKKLSLVLTDRLKLPLTSAYEVTAMGRSPYTGFFGRLDAEDHRIVRQSMEIVGAAHLAEKNFSSLSDGEKQKVLIARALAQQPKLIILDEPTSHLDVRFKIEVMRILNHLARERSLTVILSLHDIDIAVKSCSHIMLIKDGAVTAQGHPEEVISGEKIENLYDLDNASYDSDLGCIEFNNSVNYYEGGSLPPSSSPASGSYATPLECTKAPREVSCFVAGGAGYAARVYRCLAKMGFDIAAGILHKNDVDYRIASLMKLHITAEECFCAISDQTYKEAEAAVRSANLCIDSGFPVGSINKENITLLCLAASLGIPCYSLRGKNEIASLYKDDAANVICVSSIMELQKFLAGGLQNLEAPHIGVI